jgi:hypothetical protein
MKSDGKLHHERYFSPDPEAASRGYKSCRLGDEFAPGNCSLDTPSLTCDGRHETEIHPTVGTVVFNEYPLSLSFAQIDHTFTVGGNSINHGRVVRRIPSHFQNVIRSDLHYPQFSSLTYGGFGAGGGVGATPPGAVARPPLIAFEF